MVAERAPHAPEIRRYGDEWTFTWQAAAIGIGVTRVRETEAGQVRAEITVESLRPGQTGLLWWGQVTLGAQADRERLVKALREAAPDITWGPAVTRLCQYVAHEARKPEPLRVLADVPSPPQAAHLAAPVLATGQTNILMATGGAGKSLLALRIAISVTLGIRLPWGGEPAATGPVIYYDWETDAATQARRLRQLAEGLVLDALPRDLHYRRMRGRLVDRLPHLRAEVARLGAALVIIDSLGFACNGDLNSSEIAVPTMDAIADLGENVTKLVLAHYAKAHRESNAPATVYGSAFFEFAARQVWEMRRGEEDRQDSFVVGLFHRKANDARLHPEPLGMRVTYGGNGAWVSLEPATVLDAPGLEMHVPITVRLRELLAQGPWRTDELADALGVDVAQVRKGLHTIRAINITPGRGRGNVGTWTLSKNDPQAPPEV